MNGGTPKPSPGSVAEPPVLDPSKLDHIFPNDDGGRAKLIAQFLQRARTTVSDLRDAVSAVEASAASDLAHGLKGSSAMVGATRLSHVANLMDNAVVEGRLSDAALIQEELEETLRLTDAAFSSEPQEAYPIP